jgi:hypothetical protein
MVLGSKRSVPALLLQSWAKRDALLTKEAKRGRFAYLRRVTRSGDCSPDSQVLSSRKAKHVGNRDL